MCPRSSPRMADAIWCAAARSSDWKGMRPPGRLVIVEFPDMARLKAFYASADYQALLTLRQRAARTSLLAIEGVSAPRGAG